MPASLLLIDGYAAVYRAFYAIKELSTASGQPTNALFGFIRMLNQLKDSVRPTHLAVIFDGGMPADRVALVPEYKAQRPSRPADLDSQLPLIERYLDAAAIPRFVVQGEEADDVLASLADKFSGDCERVLIATGDKDLFQVVNERVQMVKLSGGNDIVGIQQITDKTGVTPEQTLEWLALIGDNADNIGGVPGVGAKTATKLINQFGSIESLYENIEDVASDRIRGALIDSHDIVLRNIAMIRLKRNLECVDSLDELSLRDPDESALLKMFVEFEFTSMAKAIREPELF